MFNLHTFWSIGVSIALVEALFPADAEMPWLGRVGDSVVAVVFVLGTAANFGIGFKQNQFVASKAQLLSAAVLSVLLIVSAFLIPARRSRRAGGMVPSPWVTGAVVFVLGMGIMNTPPKWGWPAVGALLAIDAVFLVLVTLFSRQTGWGAQHTLSLAVGGALGYGIHAFTQGRSSADCCGCASATRFFSPLRFGWYGWTPGASAATGRWRDAIVEPHAGEEWLL